ncbi:hypothetical protein ACFWXA_14785 [Streptomyces atroolivaceus]|uniref:hypothetical protein n=1 Tax=Streptomyces atroolivaceus TaxID=66869 RepID=UPI003669D6BB
MLGNTLMDGVFHTSAAMSAALPFLIRLAAAADIGIAVRPGLVDLLIVAAELSQPVDAGNERHVLLLGNDRDHPEREWCRAAFTAHASALRALLDDSTFPDGLISENDRECLRRVVEPQRSLS